MKGVIAVYAHNFKTMVRYLLLYTWCGATDVCHPSREVVLAQATVASTQWFSLRSRSFNQEGCHSFLTVSVSGTSTGAP